MEVYDQLSQLKPGDDVIVNACDWTGSSYRYAKVEKITPTGLIRVDGVLYRPQNGISRSGASSILCPQNEEAVKRLREYQEKEFVRRTMYRIRNTNYNEVTYEQAVQIGKIMGWGE